MNNTIWSCVIQFQPYEFLNFELHITDARLEKFVQVQHTKNSHLTKSTFFLKDKSVRHYYSYKMYDIKNSL